MGTTSIRRPWGELTLLLLAAGAVLIAAAVAGKLGSEQAWTLVAMLAAGYTISGGFARSRPPVRAPSAAPVSAPITAAREGALHEGPSVVASEEQLEVDRQRVPRERVRMRKEVVTEHVTITVPVRREVVRLEREPIEPGTDLGTGLDAIGEGVTPELVLMEERAVVDKQVVPRERVWLEKDVVTHEEHITEAVRREEVEIDRDAPDQTRQEPTT